MEAKSHVYLFEQFFVKGVYLFLWGIITINVRIFPLRVLSLDVNPVSW